MLLLQFGCFWGAGQVCSATSRLLVHSSISEAFHAQLKNRAEEIKICDPNQPECRLGPVVNQSQYDKIMKFIEVSIRSETALWQACQKVTNDKPCTVHTFTCMSHPAFGSLYIMETAGGAVPLVGSEKEVIEVSGKNASCCPWNACCEKCLGQKEQESNASSRTLRPCRDD